MGSIPYAAGATFRVWAPSAASVAVAGSFNSWSKQANPLAAEGNGYWSTDVASAKPGDRYKYVIVYQSTELNPWRPDPYGQAMVTSAGDTLIYDQNFDWGSSTFQMPGWDEMVIYELHIGTYSDEQGGGPGRLSSVIARLDHLVEFGVNAIQVLPPAEFPGGFSWGYNPSSIFTVETDYGGPDALKQLIQAAHEHGLAVICDVVYNHFGNGDAALWRFDGWHQGEKGGIYYYSDWRDFTPWGHTRPDYGRPEVRQFLRDNALLWLEQYRFDGLRWDATNYVRNVYGGADSGADLTDGWNLMRWVNDDVNRRQPWKLCIAEDMQNNEWITKPTGDGGAGFDTQWDAGFIHPVRSALTQTLMRTETCRPLPTPSSIATTATRCRGSSTPSPTTRSPPAMGNAGYLKISILATPAAGMPKPLDTRRSPCLHRPRDPDDLPRPGAARRWLLA